MAQEGIHYVVGPNVDDGAAAVRPVAEQNNIIYFPYAFPGLRLGSAIAEGCLSSGQQLELEVKVGRPRLLARLPDRCEFVRAGICERQWSRVPVQATLLQPRERTTDAA